MADPEDLPHRVILPIGGEQISGNSSWINVTVSVDYNPSLWCKENCAGQWSRGDIIFVDSNKFGIAYSFELAEDAMMFRLIYG